MRIFTLNEKDNPDLPADKVRADFAKARRLMGRGLVIGGLQEIGEVADHVALRNQFTGYTEINRKQATPQVYGRRLKLYSTRYVECHKGKAGRSPHRGYQISVFTFRFRPWLKPFVFINTHMVSHPEKDEWGYNHWWIHWNKLTADVARIHSSGYDVFVTGDFNKVNLPKIHDREKILQQHRLDHILFVPADHGNIVKRTDGGYYHRGFHTDHPLVWVDVKVSKK